MRETIIIGGFLLLSLAAMGCAQHSTVPDAVDCSLEDQRYAAGIGANTTLLAELQDELLWCLEDNRSFDNGRALALMDSFSLGPTTGIAEFDRANPLRSNNLAIRSDLIRLIIMQRKNASYAPDFGSVLSKIREYGFQSGTYTTWYEGSGYLLYTLAAVRQANRNFNDPSLRSFEASSERWLADFALPDGTLAPIGDTALGTAYTEPKTGNRTIHTDHETAIFFDDGAGYLLFRHPANNTLPGSALRNDLHTQFDFGAVYLWYAGSWRVRPVGYPGYAIKTQEGLDDKFNYNIQSAERIGGDFTQNDADRMDIPRYLDSWRAKTSAIVPENPVSRAEYPDRYEIIFTYVLNTGEGGAYENYSRTVTLYKNQRRMDISDRVGGASFLMVSDDAMVTSAVPVSCDYGGEWSPAYGRVEESRRCAVRGTALDYTVKWQ